MGRGIRQKPTRLAQKLLQIRTSLNLSQNSIIRQLDFGEEITQDYISAYERGVREPPLPILLKYARAVKVSTDVLIDDELDLATEITK